MMHDRSMRDGGRRPVVALMGEFSAGKSTLANLLLGERVSPERVTATQMPPIWYTHGADAPTRVDLAGASWPLDLDALDEVDQDDTAYIRIPREAGVLEMMDLLDFPGISDPNMSSAAWKRLIHEADSVIWCSHATQAWRQSEAATWADLPPALYPNSLLLLTRFDKLRSETDRRRVLARVRSETDGLFDSVFPISLLHAATAEEDRAAWEESGAEAFTERLLELLPRLTPAKAAPQPPASAHATGLQATREDDGAQRHGDDRAHRVVPKRVVPRSGARTRRERLPASALERAAR